MELIQKCMNYFEAILSNCNLAASSGFAKEQTGAEL